MVNHNGGEETLASVNSLLADLSDDDLLVLVDNGTTDGSGVRASQLSGRVYYIGHEDNKPFAEATNIGIRYALECGFPYIGLINPDVRVQPGMVDSLATFLDNDRHEHIAAVSPVILYDSPDDRIWYAGGQVLFPISWTRHNGQHERLSEFRKSPFDTQFVTGCCWLSPAWAWDDHGELDSSYGMYAEDVDWSTRVWRAEKRMVVNPEAVLVHNVSASSGGGRSPLKMVYRTLAGRLFFERWTPPCLRFIRRILTPPFVVFYTAFLYLADGPKPAAAYLRAWRTKLKDPVPWPPSRNLTGNL